MWSLFTTMCVCVYLLLEYLALANEIVPELMPNDSSLFSAIYNSQEIKNDNQRLLLNHVDSREQGITKPFHSLHILLKDPQENIYNTK